MKATDLRVVLQLLPTPTARDSKGTDAPGRTGGVSLPVAARMLPTPTARLGTPSGAQAKRYVDPERSNDLDDAAAWAELNDRWGEFAEAIARWEQVIGRPAPEPLEEKHLNPRFVEWMMGYPEGWVEGASRTQQLKMLGNAVVERQASRALQILMERAGIEF